MNVVFHSAACILCSLSLFPEVSVLAPNYTMLDPGPATLPVSLSVCCQPQLSQPMLWMEENVNPDTTRPQGYQVSGEES